MRQRLQAFILISSFCFAVPALAQFLAVGVGVVVELGPLLAWPTHPIRRDGGVMDRVYVHQVHGHRLRLPEQRLLPAARGVAWEGVRGCDGGAGV